MPDDLASLAGEISMLLPYRGIKYSDSPKRTQIDKEMETACLVLHRWAKFNPVIAGGALWSWAAGKPANDIDIFVKSSWRTRRLAAKRLGIYSIESLAGRLYCVNNYGSIGYKSHDVKRYLCDLPTLGKTMDFVLTPWRGIEVVHHFDYEHLAVAFGAKEFTIAGAIHYANGELESKRWNNARSKVIMQSKLHSELWGKPAAMACMSDTIAKLGRIYNETEGTF